MTRLRFLLLACLAFRAFSAEVFPGVEWERGRSARWSEQKLTAARDYAATIKTAAVMIIQNGKVVDEWGDTTTRFNCHSMRKSILSALYGIHVAEGRIDLDKSLADLNIDDNEPKLTETEKKATIRMLIKARSGIYHAALYETPEMTASKPPRGSHEPGTFWHYNNWDFNALGAIFEQLTKSNIYEEFDRRIAKPTGMQDFRLEDGKYFKGDLSIHPAYPFRMTARDLARFGHLFLRNGKWGDRQIVPASWVKESVASYSDTRDGEGYGYMWWVRPDGYYAAGAGGHYVVVLPARDMVVVHRVNTDIAGNSVNRADFLRLLNLILAAEGPAPNPALTPVQDVSGLPRVLLIGDSISMGYTIPVRRLLDGAANVHRIGENGGPTIHGVANIDRWIGTSRWDVIHFNFGLHDLKRMDDGKHQVSLPDYEKNLRLLVERLRKTGAKLIWASTTPVPEGKVSPPRVPTDVEAYNAAALRVMREYGVTINDLNAFVQPRLSELQLPVNVHFTAAGSDALAGRVAASIRSALQ